MTRHGLIWLALIVAIFMISPLLVSPDEYKTTMDREIATAQRWYGEEEFADIAETAHTLYQGVMVRTGIDGLLRNHFTKPLNDEIAPGYKLPAHISSFAKPIDGYWKGLLENFTLFFFRLAQAWLWAYYMGPFILASIFDGIMYRKAKIASFQYTSPTLYNASWHLIIFLMAASLVSFSITINFSPLAYPMVIASIGFLIRLLISNIQHSA